MQFKVLVSQNLFESSSPKTSEASFTGIFFLITPNLLILSSLINNLYFSSYSELNIVDWV